MDCRQQEKCERVNLQLICHGIPPIIDVTRVGQNERQRVEDILHWVESHAVRCWVVLDDYSGLRVLGEHLILVAGGTGLTERNASQVINYLNG